MAFEWHYIPQFLIDSDIFAVTTREIEVRLNHFNKLNICPKYRTLKHNISRTLDFMCDVSDFVRTITITGPLVPSLCSLEYGGGNFWGLPLKELIRQGGQLVSE